MGYRMFKERKKCNRGSLTVEAAVIMPFFICVILSFAFFIKIVYTQSVLQHAINETANELSVYSYLYSASGAQKYHEDTMNYLEEKSKTAQSQINDTIEAVGALENTKESLEKTADHLENPNFDELMGDLKENKEFLKKNVSDAKKLKETLENAIKNPKQEIISFATLLAQGAFEDLKGALASPVIRIMCRKHLATESLDADKRLKSLGIREGLDGLDFSETKILYDKENIDIIVRYKVDIGLPIKLLPDLYFVQRANVRAWLDGDGKKPGSSEDVESNSNVWLLSVRDRTKRIFELEGKDTPEMVSIIKYNAGDIIDVTSINLSEKHYIQTSAVKSRINASIRKLQEFNSTQFVEIKSKTLIVIIPEKSLETREDVKKLLTDECLKYAKDRGIILKYKEAYGTLPKSSV
ncbi:MAG: hypothetical protein BWY74_02586 [Firmicutes bacterium ADurb.Bin419]|nr:MAG: hypothetical protein BWY74_02586 [Firmicutes bacterium ADurb.Bin419]